MPLQFVRGVARQPIESRLLVVASGRMSPLAERVGFPSLSGGSMWVAHVSAEGKQPKAPKQPRVAMVLGLDGGI